MSSTVTPVAGTGPALLAVMSNPMLSPALTGPGGFDAFETSTCEPTMVTDSFASLQFPATGLLPVSPG